MPEETLLMLSQEDQVSQEQVNRGDGVLAIQGGIGTISKKPVSGGTRTV